MTVGGDDAAAALRTRGKEAFVNDKDLQDAVIRELEWDPMVDAAHIGVSAKDGAITLTGHVPSYAEKLAAVTAAE
ncbi:MAG: BON domain-containing protein, partial [Gemmatimonadaceae bacterium]